MPTIKIGSFEITQEYEERLLAKLKNERVENREDLRRYLKDYTYLKDAGRKCHLLISPTPKKESFALPYDEK